MSVAEDELRRSRDFLETTLQAIADAITVQDASGQLVYANEAAARSMGFDSVDELLHTPNSELLRRFEILNEEGEPFPIDQLPAALILRGEQAPPVTLRWRIAASGIEHWSLVKATPVLDASGRVHQAISIIQDISDRKEAEEWLHARARQAATVARVGQLALQGMELTALMEQAASLVATTLENEFCKVLELLPDGKALLLRAGVGWKPGIVGTAHVGTDLDSQAGYTLVSDAPVVVEDLRTEQRFNGPPLLVEHGVVSGMSVIIQGTRRPFGVLGTHSTCRRVFTEDDVHFLEAIANVLATAIQRKAVEEELALLLTREQEARTRAENAVRIRDELLSIVSHDLKNPLAAIHGNAQLLRRRIEQLDGAAAQKESLSGVLARVEGSVSRMGMLINELMDFANLQEGRLLSLQPRHTDLVVLARQVAVEQQQSTMEHRIRINADNPSLVGVWDPDRLERVLSNLLSNAVKYSPDGGEIEVRITREEDGAGSWALLSVRDHGLGIPSEDLPHVFEWFRRAHNVSARIGGAGIGLANTRQIVEQHGGSVAVASREGEGSTFTVRLPLVTTPASG